MADTTFTFSSSVDDLAASFPAESIGNSTSASSADVFAPAVPPSAFDDMTVIGSGVFKEVIEQNKKQRLGPEIFCMPDEKLPLTGGIPFDDKKYMEEYYPDIIITSVTGVKCYFNRVFLTGYPMFKELIKNENLEKLPDESLLVLQFHKSTWMTQVILQYIWCKAGGGGTVSNFDAFFDNSRNTLTLIEITKLTLFAHGYSMTDLMNKCIAMVIRQNLATHGWTTELATANINTDAVTIAIMNGDIMKDKIDKSVTKYPAKVIDKLVSILTNMEQEYTNRHLQLMSYLPLSSESLAKYIYNFRRRETSVLDRYASVLGDCYDGYCAPRLLQSIVRVIRDKIIEAKTKYYWHDI